MLGCSLEKVKIILYFFFFSFQKRLVFEWIKQHFWLYFWQCSFPYLEVSLSAVLVDSLTSSMQKCVAVQYTAWYLEWWMCTSALFFSVLKKWIFYLLFFSGNVHARFFLSNAEIREFVYLCE